MTEDDLFAAALEHADPTGRAAFLAGACADPAARRRIEELLAAHDAAGSFLNHPAVGTGPTRTMPPTDPDATATLGGVPVRVAEILTFLLPPTRPGSLGRLAHYEVLAVLGSGGFGTVLKAFDDRLHRVVAVKVLAPQLAASGAARARFLREARNAAAVRDDHVVNVFEVGGDGSVPYLAMEFVAGQTLQHKLEKVGPLPVKEVLRIGAQTARGLAAAHATGLIHRDVKPANILMENGVERVKLTDFGLARAADDASLSHSGTVTGTPRYMSPEQARGDVLDARSDLFSLGSVLYALCTGRPPFHADSTLAVLKRVVDDDPRPVREVNPEVPRWLAGVVEKLHAKAPADRFQTAKEVADLLAGYLAEYQQHGSVTPPADPAPPRRAVAAGGLSRRHGWWLVPAVVLLAGLGWRYGPHLLLLAADRAEVRFESDDPDADLLLSQNGTVVLTQTGPGTVRIPPGLYEARLRHPVGRSGRFGYAHRGWITSVSAAHESLTVFTVDASAGDRVTVTAGYEGRPNPAVVSLRFGDPAMEFQVDDTGPNQTGVSATQTPLEPGEHRVWFKLGDRHYRTAPFTVAAGERSELELEVTPAGGRATLNGRPLAVTPDPRPPRRPSAPLSAMAPFTADQAKAHQEAWATHLGVPVEFTNDLGMTFRLIPPGEFGMGFTDGELAALREELKTLPNVGEFERFAAESSGPRHTVRITRAFYLAKYETTAALFQRFLADTRYTPSGRIDWTTFVTPGQEDRQPVLGVSWADATAFCTWLHRAGGGPYDLPTEAQWEYAARAGASGLWSFGNDPKQLIDHAVVEQRTPTAGPVGLKRANPFGLFDVHGNVDEWCRDWHIADFYRRSPIDDPVCLDPPAQPGTGRAARGGAWSAPGAYSRSAARTFDNPTTPALPKGFRVMAEAPPRPAAAGARPNLPPPAVAPFDAAAAKGHQEAWAKHLGVPVETVNTAGMKMRLVPPGRFPLRPDLRVTLTRPFRVAAHEVTVAQFRAFVEETKHRTSAEEPGGGTVLRADGTSESGPQFTWRHRDFARGDDYPVSLVSWDDAVAYCRWLGQKEGKTYRLPTEAEWEWVCRAGPGTEYALAGDPARAGEYAWVAANADGHSHPVGRKRPNAWGLYDAHGNVAEWCSDWFGQFGTGDVTDPTGPAAGKAQFRLARGNSFINTPADPSLTNSRGALGQTAAMSHVGFRVVCEDTAVGPVPAPPNPAAVAPLRELVAAREKARERAKIRLEAGLFAPYHVAAAEFELADARARLAEAEGDRAGVVARLQELVGFARAYRTGVEPRVALGADPPDVLTQADAQLAEARARLARAGGTEPQPPRPKEE